MRSMSSQRVWDLENNWRGEVDSPDVIIIAGGPTRSRVAAGNLRVG